jgi:hypothetical protein
MIINFNKFDENEHHFWNIGILIQSILIRSFPWLATF